MRSSKTKTDERNPRKVEKLKSGSCSKSIRDDMKEDNMIFSEESSRVIYEMGKHGVVPIETDYNYYSV